MVAHLTIPPAVWFIAQSIPMPAPDSNGVSVAEIIKNLGVLFVLAWYLWYNTSVALPRILEAASKEREANAIQHRAEREAMTAAYSQEVDRKRTDFLKAMSEQRVEFRQALDDLTDAIRSTGCKFEHKAPS